MIKNKSAQMKIQQMAFMLIAVTLFFALVGMVILVIYMSSLGESSDLLEQEKAMRLATKIANSPEFACGGSFGEKTNCVDFDKVLILKESVDKYKEFWRVDNIMILKIFPPENFEVECNAGNYDECGQLKLMEGNIGLSYSNYVTLCRKASNAGELYNKCEIARILVDPRESEDE